MIVARYSHGQLTIVDRLREPVRLGAGLDEQDRLNRESIARALACLERFGQRLHDMKASSVRVVGTNTLRKAKRKGAFLDRAREALGHPIEIIAGVEEARLIYLGVAHTTPSEGGHRLVMDIGGGSTELIIGEGFATKRLESLYIGCVSMMSAYFADGEITEKRMRRARTAAQLELEPVTARFRRSEWDSAVGASGTMRAVSDVLLARGVTNGQVTRDGVHWLIDECLRAGAVSKLKLPELTQDRQEILPGGLAIMVEAFDMLGIESMRVADGALREGLLYDLLGRFTDEDARARSVRAMEARFHVDAAQADRVETTVLAFLRQVRETWGLEDPLAELVLRWAARLHEIGLDIAHAHYHRHGAYLLQHADMPGFPREEQRLLSVVVGGHRRKLNRELHEDLVPPWHLKAEFLIVLLRLAVLLNRGRGPRALPEINLAARGRALEVAFPKGWLGEHPLTAADLEQEAEYLRAAGFRLRVG
ncbi:MAG: Ppx/GppA family phosphatase [Gammaproteobacteria bacterium]|nr:Ppx/GppA family phosphatase [Gammaproteobacteria bacterium]